MTLLYDGSFTGLLSSVFEAYRLKVSPERIQPIYTFQPRLFQETVIEVNTCDKQAERVRRRLLKEGGKKLFKDVLKVYQSEHAEREMTLFTFIQLVLVHGADARQMVQHPAVFLVDRLVKQMGREIHRMHAFVRFEQATNGVYYSLIEPDFDVLPFIGEHFRNRYADQYWMIYDKRRAYGLLYDQFTVQYMMSLHPEETHSLARPALRLEAHEQQYADLWKTYFEATNIPARYNPSLHRKHLPKRYWKYLTEKGGGSFL